MFLRQCLLSQLLAASSILRTGFGGNVPSQDRACHSGDEDRDDAALLQVKGAVSGMRADDGQLASSKDPSIDSRAFGPMTSLIGTWAGNLGVNSMSLPEATENDPSSFIVLSQNYSETITFEPIWGNVLNRGYLHANQVNAKSMQNQTLRGLTYIQKIHDLSSGDLLHEENGQWLWNMDPGVGPPWTVTRVGIIPHGVVVSAPANVSRVSGEDVLAEQKLMSSEDKWSIEPRNMGRTSQAGYFEGAQAAGCCPAGSAFCEWEDICTSPTKSLYLETNATENLNKIQATRFEFSTTNPGGGLLQFPDIKKQVFNFGFNATFWLTSRLGARPDKEDTLQYAQSVIMAFKCNSPRVKNPEKCTEPEQVIFWPHVQVNRLKRVMGPTDDETQTRVTEVTLGAALPTIR